MHSLIMTGAITVWVLLSALGVHFATSQVAAGLAVSVALVGMPHGGLDHEVGRRVMQSRSADASFAYFFLAYLGVVALVVIGWFLFPLLTIIVFFSLSAWHFGLEENEAHVHRRWQWAAMVARGGMVIWVPALFHADEIASLLEVIVPSDRTFAAMGIVQTIQLAAPLLIGLTLLDAIIYSRSDRSATFGLSPAWQHRLRIGSFAVLFATASPLVSFGLYFCGWHSIRGLIHLHQQIGRSLHEFMLSLLPMTVAALLLSAAGLAFSSSFQQLTPAIIQTIFISLSAVAIPHLLLHIISDSLKTRPAVRGALS